MTWEEKLLPRRFGGIRVIRVYISPGSRHPTIFVIGRWQRVSPIFKVPKGLFIIIQKGSPPYFDQNGGVPTSRVCILSSFFPVTLLDALSDLFSGES